MSETQRAGTQTVAAGVRLILDGLREIYGPSFDRYAETKNFRGTPERVARAYLEILSGLDQPDRRIRELLSKTFPCSRDSVVAVSGVRTFSLCPHHLMPVDYEVAAAYLPSLESGCVIGLSKIPRLIDLLARRPVLQENFTDDVADRLMDIPGCKGSACFARGRHYCMAMRGAEQPDAATTTSSLRGAFLQDSDLRAEFLALARKRDL